MCDFSGKTARGVYGCDRSETKLPPATLNRQLRRRLGRADIEADGDLDIVLGASYATAPVLRNNGDGTFTEIQSFPKHAGMQGFAWADLDADGDPDAALIDGAWHAARF